MSSPEFQPSANPKIEKETQKPLFTTEVVELTIVDAKIKDVKELINGTFHPQTTLLWERLPTGVHEVSIRSKGHVTKFFSVHRTRPNLVRIISNHSTHRAIDELLEDVPNFVPAENCVVGLWPHIQRKRLKKAAYDVVVSVLRDYNEFTRQRLREERGIAFPDHLIPIPLLELAQKQMEIQQVIEMVADDIDKLTSSSLDLLSR